MRVLIVRWPLAAAAAALLTLAAPTESAAVPIAWSVRSDVDGRLYQIDLATGIATPAPAVVGFTDVEGLTFQPGTGVFFGVADHPDQLLTIHLGTGAGTAVSASLGLTPNPGDPSLAFDATGRLFLAESNSKSLYEVNPVTGTAILVGSLGGLGEEITALSFRADGTLFGMGAGKLFTVDTVAGTSALVGSLGFPVDDGGIAFDSHGVLWGIEDEGRIFTLDTSTGSAVVVFSQASCGGSGCKGFESLAILPEPGLSLLLATGLLLARLRRKASTCRSG